MVQTLAHTGSLPSRSMCGQNPHFSIVPFRCGYMCSGEYAADSSAAVCGGSAQLKDRAEYGHWAMHSRQPMHRSLSCMTIPSVRLNVAPTGQARTQGGLSQCMHGRGM